MAELVEARRPLEVGFLPSLPLNLLLTMALLPAVDQFEGLDEWLREARSALPAGRRGEIALLTGFAGGHLRFVEAVAGRLLRSDEQAALSFEGFRECLLALPPATYQEMALQALRKAPPEMEEDPREFLDDPPRMESFLLSRSLHVDAAAAAALVLDPDGLQRRFVDALTSFWEELYRPDYEENLPLMERSVAYHRRQSYPPQFDELFLAVTGRVLPIGVQFRMKEFRRARFVPAGHLGPYVAFFGSDDLLTVFYNYRGALLEERQAGERVRHMYPLLKALADETRLQIMLLLREREMYARELVDALGLSQPAVSRQLKLMVTAGLLQVRPEGGAKYYFADRKVLEQLLEELRSLLP